TSSQVTGIDTVGRSRARSEYTQTVVLCGSFWLQSRSTFPERSDFFIFETTSCGHFAARASATARANALVSSYVARALSGRYICRPIVPELFDSVSSQTLSNVPLRIW